MKENYNTDLITELENICNKFDYLLQEGVVLSLDDKNKMLKLIKYIKYIIEDFVIE